MQQRNCGFWLFLLLGPYAFFTLFFCFFLPPIGFLMAYHGYKKDKAIGERYGGWIVSMTISVLSTIFIIVFVIVAACHGFN